MQQVSMRHLLFLALCLPFVIVAQPSANMELLGSLDVPNLPERFGAKYNDCWGFKHDNGTEVAIIGGIEDIFFVDVTVPSDPVIIYTHHVLNLPTGSTNQSLWRDFKTYGNYAYASADEGTSGLLIFDLSQVPDTVTMVNQITSFWNRAHNIHIDTQNGKLYAAGSNTVNNGLIIVDLIPDPAHPTTNYYVPLNSVGGGYVHDVYVSDNVAYCSHGNLQKLQIYDFTNMPSFTVVGAVENYPEPGYNHSSWVSPDANWLVMADETHGSDLKLVDISDPGDISSDDIHTFYSELLGAGAPGSSIVHNPFILGDLVYLSYYHDGVQVFDISNPENITQVGYYDTYPDNTGYSGYEGCWGVYPYLPSGIIIASDMTYGLFVLELTAPPLDITFIDFTAGREKNNVRLEWMVADASNGNTFRVSRSTDGGQTFEDIGHVALLPDQEQYSFVDNRVAGSSRYTYRIDFLEHDGHFVSSPLRVIRTLPASQDFRVVNPMQSQLVIDVLNPMAWVQFELYNVDGTKVWASKVEQPGFRQEFNPGDLPAGQYVLTIQSPTSAENIIIQKPE